MFELPFTAFVLLGIAYGQKTQINPQNILEVQHSNGIISDYTTRMDHLTDSNIGRASTVETETQTLSAIFSNPSDQFQEFIVLDVLRHHSVLKRLTISEVVQSTNGRKRSPIEVAFLDKRSTRLSIKPPRGKSSPITTYTNSTIKWLTREEIGKYQNVEETSNLFQFSGIWIRAAPNTDYEVNVVFAEEILAEEEEAKIKGLYSSQLIFHVIDTGYAIEGMVKSPSYPLEYPANSNVKWLIHIPLRHLYTLQFTLTELETESCCDKLYVYKGTDASSPPLKIFSGDLADVENPVLNTFSSDLFVTFQSDCTSEHPGVFSFTYATTVADEIQACASQTILPNAAGYITSPGYPVDYPEESDCSWLIVSDEGYYPSLSIDVYDLAEADYVGVYEVYLTNRILIKILSSEDVGTVVYGGKVNQMSIDLHTELHGLLYEGFSFKYSQSVIPTACTTGVVISGEASGVIESPNYPNPYGNNQTCEWQINGKEGEGIHIRFVDLDLEYIYDHVLIYDGVEISAFSQLADLTGSAVTESVFLSESSTIIVKFISDNTNDNYRGFQMELSGYTKTQSCSTNVTTVDGEQGFLASPNYPNPYPSFTNCQYLIEVKSGYIVNLVFANININIATDLLIVYDGPTTSYEVLFTSGGLPQPNEILLNSTSDKVLVTFQSGTNALYRGFSLRFLEIDIFGVFSGTIEYDSPRGKITSPSYPGKYPDFITASWEITTPRRTYVSLLIREYMLSDGDTLTGYDGHSTVDDVLFVCQGIICNVKESTRNQMLLVFDGKVSNTGFDIDYFATGNDCESSSQQVSDTEGYMTSPLFPGNYPNGVDCNETIVVTQTDVPNPVDFLIRFEIGVVQTEFNYDFLKIYNGVAEDDASLLYVGTGTKGGEVVYSNSSEALVVWDVDNSVSYIGYSLHWEAVETKVNESNIDSCAFIGVITNLEGQIFSPSYPSDYPVHVDYCWMIELAEGYSGVDFFIPQFHSETNFDWMAFYSASSLDESALVQKLTGDHFNTEIQIEASDITLHFHTDGSVQDSGFFLHYVAKRF